MYNEIVIIVDRTLWAGNSKTFSFLFRGAESVLLSKRLHSHPIAHPIDCPIVRYVFKIFAAIISSKRQQQIIHLSRTISESTWRYKI